MVEHWSFQTCKLSSEGFLSLLPVYIPEKKCKNRFWLVLWVQQIERQAIALEMLPIMPPALLADPRMAFVLCFGRNPAVCTSKCTSVSNFLGLQHHFLSRVYFLVILQIPQNPQMGSKLHHLSAKWQMALHVIKCVGLRTVQGSLEFGKDADIVIWDPEASFILDNNYPIFHKHKVHSRIAKECCTFVYWFPEAFLHFVPQFPVVAFWINHTSRD